jgi:hypothetical protein
MSTVGSLWIFRMWYLLVPGRFLRFLARVAKQTDQLSLADRSVTPTDPRPHIAGRAARPFAICGPLTRLAL